ncbi:MAG: DNA-binding response regulator [Bacteroidetes bacterium]|nr:MAG: DNA-binding response regulator [Bacteroidota bacterium]
MEKIRMLLVDDHQVLRDGIKYTLGLQEKIHVDIDEAENGSEAIAMAKQFTYDVIVMDINMPDVNGIEATESIIANNKDARILAVSMHDEEYYIVKMIQAGAKGYILKSTGSEELLKAISNVAQGKKYYSSEVSVKLMGSYHDDIVKRKPRSNKNYKGILSKRELEVLNLIADEYTNDEIAKKLYISKRTVDSHRQNMLNKTQAKNTAGLLRYAVKNNLI